MLKINILFTSHFVVYFLLCSSISFAQQTDQEKKDEELTKAAQNPIAKLDEFSISE